jgi:hypothetical protein
MCMNSNREGEPSGSKLLDGLSSGIDILSAAGEMLGFIGEAKVAVLSALLDLFSGL